MLRDDVAADRCGVCRLVLLLLTSALAGCTGFGPHTLSYQQADYAAALADAGKRQTLLNIVKLRYGDVPAFVTVNQILAGYSLQGTVSVGTEVLTGGSFQLSDDANVGLGGTFTNSPTITYAPVTGADFARTFLAPLQPADLFGLMLSSVPPELVLGLGLHSMGPYNNERATADAQLPPDPMFTEVLALLLELQRAGRLPIQLAVGSRERVASVKIGPGATEDSPERRLRSLLALPADRENFEIIYSLGGARPGEIPIRTRSLLEVMGQIAADIVVPEGDVRDGRTDGGDHAADGGDWLRLPHVHIRHGLFEPRDAFAAVPYDGDWFWIANSDFGSKRVFSFVMLLLSLSESSRPGQAPVITYPAG